MQGGNLTPLYRSYFLINSLKNTVRIEECSALKKKNDVPVGDMLSDKLNATGILYVAFVLFATVLYCLLYCFTLL